MLEVLSGLRRWIDQERAARAAFFPCRAEHEVVDDELGSPIDEKIGQRFFSPRPVEHVFLFDFDPRQLAPLRIN